MCEIHPVGTSVTIWPVLNKVYSDVFGQSLSSRLDGTCIKTDDPASIIGCLDIDATNPMAAFRQETRYWKHCPLSLLIVCSSWEVIVALSSFVTVTFEQSRKQFVIYASGTLYDWFRLISHLNTITSDSDLRDFGNKLTAAFSQGILREALSSKQKIQQKDGTFLWK